MKLLLDTQAFLWFIGGDERLSPSAWVLVEDMGNDAYLSVAQAQVEEMPLVSSDAAFDTYGITRLW